MCIYAYLFLYMHTHMKICKQRVTSLSEKLSGGAFFCNSKTYHEAYYRINSQGICVLLENVLKNSKG